MADLYVDDQQEASPAWLRQPFGARWAAALGEAKDVLAQLARQAVKARFPLLCPEDALARLGEERGLPRGVAETVAAYRLRLQAAWEAWRWAGTPYGLLRAFQLAGFPTVLVQTQGPAKQFGLGAGGTVSDLSIANMTAPVHLGGTPSELASDIGVLIAQPWPDAWLGVAPANGTADQKTAAALIAKWKPAHSRCVFLKVVSGPTWDSAITWAGASAWDSGTVTTWTAPTG